MIKRLNSIFVLGNGPSLRCFDFHSIGNHDSMGMNVAFRHWHRINWYPTYYICMDTVMIETQKDSISELILKYNDRIKLFFLRKKILEFLPELRNQPHVIFLDDYLKAPYFSGITNLLTTGSFAPLFAAMLGYRKVYLLGIDLNHVERIPESEHVSGHVLKITKTPKFNPNYFFSDYQRKGEQYNIPNSTPNLHYKSWIAVKEKLEKFGVDVVNCSPISKLDLFDFADVSSLVNVHKGSTLSTTPDECLQDHFIPVADDKGNNAFSQNIKPLRMEKLILVSGHFSGRGAERKVLFFERLEACLRPVGYRLLLLNATQGQPCTTCETITAPRYIKVDDQIRGRGFTKLEEYPPEIVMSATVEKEACQTSLAYECMRFVSFSNYVKRILQKRRPALCVMWHKFNGRHYALTHLCQELGIPYLYAEYGVLPGTISFDERGQMAESWVAKRAEEFNRLPVNSEDFASALRFLEYMRENKKTGKPQDNAISILPFLEKAREQGRKLIFYAGQNDWASGILPSSLPESKLHSPIYTDTLDALGHLSELAEKYNWQILFKPHPLIQERHKEYDVPYPNRVDLALGANILDCVKRADVVTTIVSQVSYLSLIHCQPCVMLGMNQLRNKGCTAQPLKRSEVAKAFQVVLKKGFYEDLRKQWLKHVAQICKYYLFAFDNEVEAIIGRDLGKVADYLLQHARGMQQQDFASNTAVKHKMQ